MNTEKPKYEKRIVVFIDILGFKELVRQSEKDPVKIDVLYSVLDYLKSWEAPEKWNLKFIEIEEDAQKKGLTNFDIKGKTNTTCFSDSIVISVKADELVNEMASTLIVNLAYIGAILMEQGILFRGSITIGNIIHHENGTVFGQALIDAYLLETKSAKHPRIILSDKLISALNYPLEAKRNRYPYHQYLQRFGDGCIGFHQMIYYQVIDSWSEMNADKMKASLDRVRRTIITGLDASFEHVDIFEKYAWLKEQYNQLIVLSDYDHQTQTEEHVKIRIREINDGISGHNIHYSYTDNFYSRRPSDKQ